MEREDGAGNLGRKLEEERGRGRRIGNQRHETDRRKFEEGKRTGDEARD